MMQTRFLSIYLNDHLAGSMLGVRLARRALSHNEGTELGRVLQEVCAEIEADRVTLRRLMDRLGIGESRLKPAGAWVAERLGRLKLNGQLLGYSPLSRVVELEGLAVGITGKMQLWRGLERTFGEQLAGIDFADLGARAERQRAAIESQLLEAAAETFADEPAGLPGPTR